MNSAIESNLPTPPEPGEVDGSENYRLMVNSLKIFSAPLAAGIIIKRLHTHKTNKSVVFFLFISPLIFERKRGTLLIYCVP